MSERAPFLPWLPLTAIKNSWQYTTIYDAKKMAIMRLDLEDWGVDEDNQDALEEAQAQMVEYILSSCNAHDTLVKALTLAEDILSRSPFSTGIWPNGMHPMSGITQIRDALAKAKS